MIVRKVKRMLARAGDRASFPCGGEFCDVVVRGRNLRGGAP